MSLSASSKEEKMKLACLTRRSVLAAGAAAVFVPRAQAQADWPNRPIKLIVPFEPGASNDIIGRVLAQKLGALFGQSVIVENKSGAGGTLGTDYVTKSAPDGYTLLFASISITTNAAMRKSLPYDPVKDLQPIGEVGAGPLAVVVANDVKAKTLQEFIALARAKPKSINYGSAGVGGINHLGTELFAQAAKIELTHIPYKGMGPAFNDLMAGTLQMGLPTVASVAQHLNAKTMRGLAVTGAERSELAPDLPTVSEAGVPGFKLEAWWGVLAPAGLPALIIKRFNEVLNNALTSPDVKEALRREAATPRPGTPEDFGKLITSDLARWKQVVADAHIETE
jgi:tripartite-type tricarboxylate transporter receptor subunit TctC